MKRGMFKSKTSMFKEKSSMFDDPRHRGTFSKAAKKPSTVSAPSVFSGERRRPANDLG